MDSFADCTERDERSSTKLYNQENVQGTSVCRNRCCLFVFLKVGIYQKKLSAKSAFILGCNVWVMAFANTVLQLSTISSISFGVTSKLF